MAMQPFDRTMPAWSSGPFGDDMQRNAAVLCVPITHAVHLTIGIVEGGYLLSINQQNNQLCIGAESIEAGVRAVLTHLVTQGLEK